MVQIVPCSCPVLPTFNQGSMVIHVTHDMDNWERFNSSAAFEAGKSEAFTGLGFATRGGHLGLMQAPRSQQHQPQVQRQHAPCSGPFRRSRREANSTLVRHRRSLVNAARKTSMR